jgi:hypothetical protein
MIALPTWMYRDPAEVLEAKQEAEARRRNRIGHVEADPFGGLWSKGEKVMTREESEDVEGLLGVWFRWARSFRPVKGHARVASSCQGHQHEGDDDSDVVDARIEAEQAKVVDACMDSLTGIQRGVIGVVQSNRDTGNEVFRYPRLNIEQQQAEYLRAKVELMPLMRDKGLAIGDRKVAA